MTQSAMRPTHAASEPQRESPTDRLAQTSASFNLADELETLRAEPAWQTSDRNARTLSKKPHLRVVLMALKSGARLDKHEAPGAITIHALAGRLRVRLASETVELATGEILTVDGGLTHDLEALDESAILLTVAGAH
jgi:quercetin dioxygenase-like cupin family protein